MRNFRPLAIFLAAIFSGTSCSNGNYEEAAAQWVRVSNAPSGDTYSVDKSSVSNEGDVTHVWAMVNLQAPDPGGVRSEKVALLIKCDSRQFATQMGISYSANDGKGRVVHSNTTSQNEIEFLPVAPESHISNLVDFVCRN